MHRALQTTDIIGSILEFLGTSDLCQCALVAVAWALEARRVIRCNRKDLNELISRLPGDLITPGAVEALNVYSSTAYHEDYFPSAFSVVLPLRYRIVGRYAGLPTENQAPHLDFTLWGTSNTPINALNLPPRVSSETPRGLDRYQFVEILRRAARTEDLYTFLLGTQCCRRLVYSASETKAFLAFHALEQMFPSLDFFPNLTELVVSSCSHPDHPLTLQPGSVGLYVPISLTHRAKVLIIDDNRTFPTEEGPSGSDHGTSSTALILASLLNLPIGALREVIELRHNVRWSVAVNGAPPLPKFDLGSQTHHATIRDVLVRLHRGLRSMTLAIGPYRLLWELASHKFPELQELTLSHTCGEMYTDTAEPIPKGGPLPASALPNLRKLTFRGLTIGRGLYRTLVEVNLPTLTHVVLDGSPTARNALPDVAHVLEILVQLVPALEHLHVDIPIEYPGRAFVDGPMGEAEKLLDPLVLFGSLTALRHLHLVLPANAKLRLSLPSTRSTLSLLSKLPNLTHLHLNPSQSSGSDLTLDTLVAIAQKYPNLACLGVPLDPSITHLAHMPAVYRALVEGYNPSELTRLSIGLPRFTYPTGTVDALKVIFPRLSNLVVPTLIVLGVESEGQGGGNEERTQRLAELSRMSDLVTRRWRPRAPSPLHSTNEISDDPAAEALGAMDDDDTESSHDSEEDEGLLSDLTD